MDVAMIAGTLFTLVLAAVVVVGKLELNANSRVARVLAFIERNRPGIRPRKNDGLEHIL